MSTPVNQDNPEPPIQYVQAIALVNNSDPKKVSAMLMADIALFKTVQVGQETAIVETNAMQKANEFSNDLIKQLSDQVFQNLPAGTSNSDQTIIVDTNIGNQRVQANVSIIQDSLNIAQQTAQVSEQQASSTVSNTTQTQSEFSAITQLMVEISQDIVS